MEEILTVFPDWTDGPAQVKALWISGDERVHGLLSSSIVRWWRQGILDEAALKHLWNDTPWHTTHPGILHLQLRTREADDAVRSLVEAQVKGSLNGTAWPWTDWVDCLAEIDPQHPLLSEVGKALAPPQTHSLAGWIFAQIYRESTAPAPLLDGLLNDPHHLAISERLARHARQLAPHAQALRQVRWLTPYWAIGLNREADEPTLKAILGLLGAVDAIECHARLAP